MKTVTLKFTNDDARYILYALRKRHNKDGRATLRGLCEIAVRTETAALAREDLAEAEKAYEDKCEANIRQGGEEE